MEKVEKTNLDIKERQELARAIFEEAKDSGIENIQLGETKIGGKIQVTPDHSISWEVGRDRNIHLAGVIPSNQQSGVEYLQEAIEYESYDTVERDTIIELSRKAVKYEGIVASAVEALVEIPTLGGWYIDEPNEELKKLLIYWLNNINDISDINSLDESIDEGVSVGRQGGIENLALQILYGIYENGDEVLTEVWDHIPIPVLKNAKRNLPVRFISHDVAELEIDENLALMGKEVIYASYDTDVISVVTDGPSDDPKEQMLFNSVPDSIKESIKNGEDSYVLPSGLTSHFSRRNNSRSAWGVPYVVKAFPELAYKHRLRALDNATIDGLIQRLWIIKIGSDNPDSPLHVPDNTRVTMAVNSMRQLVTNNIMVWGGYDIDKLELNTSDANILSFSDRYKSADDDIQKALGIPRFLLDGTSGQANSTNGDDWVILAKTLSQMERHQIQIKRWIEKKMRSIATENGYKDSFPKFHWMFLKLQNQEKTKNIVTKLYEMNLLGVRRALHMIGLPADEIVDEMIAEEEEGLRDKLPQNILPYTDNDPGRPEETKDGDGDEGRKTKPSNPDSNRDGK